MQTQYFIKQLEGLLAINEIELGISLLRKFTKYGHTELYYEIRSLSQAQKHFREIEISSVISPSERIRFQHACTQKILELLARLENRLPLQLPGEQAELAGHLLSAIADRDQADDMDYVEVEENSGQTSAPVLLEAIPAARPIRLSVAGMIGYALILFLLGAIAPGVHILSQQWGDTDFALFGQNISQEEIADLASYYELTEISAPNHHLNFDQSVLAYWQGRMAEGMDSQRLETAFAAFREVIQQAHAERREILSHTDLYMLARSHIDKSMLSHR